MSIEITNQDHSQEDAAYNENAWKDIVATILDLNSLFLEEVQLPMLELNDEILSDKDFLEKELEVFMLYLNEKMSPDGNLLEKDLEAYRDGLWLASIVVGLQNESCFNKRDIFAPSDFSVATRVSAAGIFRSTYWQTKDNPNYTKFHNLAVEAIGELQKSQSVIVRYEAKRAMWEGKQRD